MSAPPAATGALSLEDARRVAIHAAGLTRAFAGVREALDHLAVVQLDAINAVARAHELTLATRTAGLTTGVVDDALWGESRAPVAFEYWAHAASLIPLADWPLWEFRRRRTRTADLGWRPEPAAQAQVIAAVADQGPLSMQQLRGGERAGSGWDWGPTKVAVEYLIWTGELACVRRRNWNRVFDLPERVIPDHLRHGGGDEQAGLASLVGKAGRALGVATVDDLADYLRIKPDQVLATVEDTPLLPTKVESWKQPAWSHPDAVAALESPDPPVTRFVGPFDNLIWYRRRLRRLFAFDHVLEAYKPAAKRRYGYFAMPLLHGTRFAGRADLKVDGEVLRVLSMSVDHGHDVPAACLDDAFDALLRNPGTKRLADPP